MAEPTSQLTMRELCRKIAKDAGTAYRGPAATSLAMLPIDRDDLEDIKQVINDGVRMFIADAPPSGWKWPKRIMSVNIDGTRVTGTADSASSTTLVDATLATTYDAVTDLVGWYIYITSGTGEGSYAQITSYDPTGTPGEVTVAEWLDANGNSGGTTPVATDAFAITKYETIAGDIGRYPLVENFGGEVSGKITYDKDTTHTQRVTWVPESEIRVKRQLGDSAGYPYWAAIRQVEPISSSPGPKRRYELLLYPDPSADNVLEFPYSLIFDKLDIESGVGDSASTTTIVDGERDEADDYFNGWKITIISGTGKGSYAIVTTYTVAAGTFTVVDWLKASGAAGGTDPATDSIYVVEPVNNLHPAGIKFDHVVKSACLAKAEMEFTNFSSGHVDEYIQKDLPKAYQADARSVMHTKIGKKYPYRRVWTDVEKI